LHIHPEIFRFQFPPLPRIFLILAAAALFVGGFTACVPLENQGVAMGAPEPIPRAAKQKTTPAT